MKSQYSHGTRSRYVTGCRCADCSFAELRYRKMYYWRTRKLLKVSSHAAGLHIRRLQRHGLGDPAIADCSGCGHTTIRRIRLGRQPFIYSRTAERILSVTPEGIADCALVDAGLSQRLLRELLTEGWTRRELCAALGRKGRSLSMLYQKRVTAAMQLRVERLYRKAMNQGIERLAA